MVAGLSGTGELLLQPSALQLEIAALLDQTL